MDPDRLAGVVPATVVDAIDPDGRGRVAVRLPGDDDAQPVWARLATLSAGDGHGTWFVPDVGDEVLLAFEHGEPSRPYVVGALWNGAAAPPEPPDTAATVRTVRTPTGSQVRFDDRRGGSTVTIETAGGHRVTLDDGEGAVTVATAGGGRVEVRTTGVRITSPAAVEVDAAVVRVAAATVDVDGSMLRVAGVVQCETLVADSVVASSYTPGAGNLW